MYEYVVSGEGRNWKVTADGLISRTDLDPSWQPSGEWRIVGAVRYRGRQVVQSWNWEALKAAIASNELAWVNKRGQQAIHVHDVDHGTRREWRSPAPYYVVRL